MDKPTILRKRFIPPETIDISNDELVYRDENVLITRWTAIRPRPDISAGVSYTFINDGYKISRFYDGDRNFAFWYCDIVEVIYEEDTDTYTIVDLLLDVKVMGDGSYKILDIEELADTLNRSCITNEQAAKALKCLDNLIKMINTGDFPPEICLKEDYWRI
jgi:hypothetical protein